MKIKVFLFGVLSDKFGTSAIDLENVKNRDDLLEKLNLLYPSLDKYKFAISRNREIIKSNVNFTNGDEVALLPPFAGG